MTEFLAASSSYTPNCEIKANMSLPDGVQRFAAIIEYQGGHFRGFQKQASTANTVQAELESALSEIANSPVTLVCAGRTDAGVHASHQVVHFDTCAVRPVRAWIQGVNTKLPDTIRVLGCCPVAEQFHSRFSALSRTYQYVTLMAPVPSALLSGLVTWKKDKLDVQKMAAAATHLLGEHDFSAFRASQCQAKSPFRCVHRIEVQCVGRFLVVEVSANAFLHHMVRNIMGALFEVGRGAKPPSWVERVLADRDRTLNAATAPPNGLYLTDVEYPPEFKIPWVESGPGFLYRAATVR